MKDKKPNWKKWAGDAASFIGQAIGGDAVSQTTHYFVTTVFSIHSEEVELLKSLSRDNRKGLYEAALVHITEAKKEYITQEERVILLSKARSLLLTCISNVEEDGERDKFLLSLASARLGDIYALLGNLEGAKDWYSSAIHFSETAWIEAKEAYKKLDERESVAFGSGGIAGYGLGIGAGLLFLHPASLGVAMLYMAAAPIVSAIGVGTVSHLIASKTTKLPYELSSLGEFRESLRVLKTSQSYLELPDISD
jgi:tetratricopeptide (TPR) repeat protein